MNHDKKVILYKNIFLISTISGVIGVYAICKQIIVLGWVLIAIWAVLSVIVRILIVKDKKL
ncbi:MAG: hypothetical protein LBQ13_01670 [Endomicrobium sp.]|jgi:hypothetical protein|nr:hypothetical protein [Endomicrobium sp.]